MSSFRYHVGHLAHKQRSLCRVDILLYYLLLFLLAVFLEGISPLAVNILVQQTGNGWQTLLAVAHHSHIGLDNLINLSLVNVQVDNLCLRSILRRHACDTVAETHTDGDEHITLLGLHVGSIRTVHAEHTHVERVVARQGRKAEQGSAGRDICLLEEFDEFIMCTAKLYSMPHEGEWFLGIVDEFGSFSHRLFIYRRIRVVRCNLLTFHWFPLACSHLRILCKVEHHRSRTSAAGDVESTAHSPCHILGTAYLVRPLGDWLGNTHEVYLLESIGTQGTYAYLSGDDYDWCRIHHGISDAGQCISSSRTTSDKSDAHFAADSGITLCSVSSSLLVTYQYVVKHLLFTSRVTVQCIKHWHDAAARITEDGFNILVFQGAHQCFGSCYYFFCHLYVIILNNSKTFLFSKTLKTVFSKTLED